MALPAATNSTERHTNRYFYDKMGLQRNVKRYNQEKEEDEKMEENARRKRSRQHVRRQIRNDEDVRLDAGNQ